MLRIFIRIEDTGRPVNEPMVSIPLKSFASNIAAYVQKRISLLV